MILHSDRTTKHGCSYSTFDLVNQEGKLLVCGLGEVGTADAKSHLDLFCEISDDVCSSLENKDEIINKTFINIKNLMYDRCNSQKKISKLFAEFRRNILKHTVNFDDLSRIEQEKMVEINQFFCGLHYLVWLADQAEACLRMWESIILEGRKVSSIAHGGYSNGETGVTRLIRTVFKSAQERGCEKSDKIVGFATYLKDEFGMTSILLFSFLGNRFNILFVNAVGVYLLYDQLMDFFQRIERNNKLLDVVYSDLEVLSFKIGCRALGLTEKLITGHFWKIMANELHILRMSSHNQSFLEFLDSSSEDCSKFLRGIYFCDPSFINRYNCLTKLLEPCDEQTQLMTKQCL